MIISRTPFRISFFGGGTDYPVWYEKNGGATLSTTIDKYSYLTVRPFPPFFPEKYRIVYSRIEGPSQLSEIDHPSVRETLRYLGLEDRLEIQNSADLPARSGLGSSSAFTVGLLHSLYHMLGKPVTKKKLAIEAIHIEQNLIKENVGSQDQVAVAYGGFNKITFAPGNIITVEKVRVSPERLAALDENLMLFFTGFQRNSSEIASEWIKSAPKKEPELRELRKMVDKAIEILLDERKSLDDFGRLLHEGWQIKRGLNQSVTTDHIDEVYERARRSGALGGKLLGAGQGGFMVIYADHAARPKIREALKELIHVPFKFEKTGTQIVRNGAPELISEIPEDE